MVWLIDMGYIVKAKTFLLDYIKCREYLQGIFEEEITPYVFNSYNEYIGINPSLKKFYNKLSDNGFLLELLPMKDERQKQIDIAISCQAMLNSDKDIIITTGDSDFIYLVDILNKRENNRLYLLTFNKAVSSKLKKKVLHGYFEDHRHAIELIHDLEVSEKV